MKNPKPHYIIRLANFKLTEHEQRETSLVTQQGFALEDALDEMLQRQPEWKLLNVFVADGNAFGVYIDVRE